MRTPPRDRLNLAGQRFGRLTVVKEAEHIGRERTWECTCDCGSTAVVRQQLLRAGSTKSCGCLHRELFAARQRKHGMTGTPEHLAWRNMLARCYHPRNTVYRHYGGRGITVCERWRDSFINFYADLGPKPSRDHSLDRIDPNGNYEPGNCRWATEKEQHRNQRSNRMLTLNGETRPLVEWAEASGIPRNVLDRRIRLGWSVEDALTTPVKHPY